MVIINGAFNFRACFRQTYVESTVRKHVVDWLLNVEAKTSYINRVSFLATLRPHGQLVSSRVFGGSVCSDLIHRAHIGCH